MPLSPYVPDLRALELLLVVARTGSLGAAGRELGLSQQAVSSRIRTVERTIGVSVLRRGAGGSTLTEAGALLADWAGRVLSTAEELDAGIAALRGDRDARLDLAASYTVAEYLLPSWLARLRRELGPRRGVNLTVRNSAQVADLVLSGAADIGFIEGPDLPAGLDSRTVASDELLLVVPPNHRWTRRRGGIDVTELADTALVGREPGSGTREVIDRALAAAAPEITRPDLLFELSATTAIRHAVIAGAGPALLAAVAVRDDLASGRLVRVHVTGSLNLRRELRAVWRTGPAPAGPARILLDLVRPAQTNR